MFGGCVIGQSIAALSRDRARRDAAALVPRLLPAADHAAVSRSTHVVDTIRDGRAFAHRRSTASQSGKAVFEAMASFTRDGAGYLYDLPHTSAVPPVPPQPDGFGVAGFEAVFLGPTDARDDGTYESTERKWFRMPGDIGDDVHLHTAYLGLVSDWTGMGSRPLKMDWDEDGRLPRRQPRPRRVGAPARRGSPSGCISTCTRW